MEAPGLLEKYRSKAVLLDSNLMVLLAVGLYSPTRIATFKRTDKYTREDFDLVLRIIDRFSRRVTTPQILAEVDNLTRQLPRAEHPAVAAQMQRIVSGLFDEIYRPSAEAVRHVQYAKLGLTDCATLAASEEALIMTDDFLLSNVAFRLGRDAININHLRFQILW